MPDDEAANDSSPVIPLARCADGPNVTSMVPWFPTWDGLKAELSKAVVGDKVGSYYLRGRCEPAIRSNKHLKDPALLIIDGDKSFDPDTGLIISKCVPPEDVHEALKRMGIPHIIHTSYSHDPEHGINK